ncbi:uncharacterized protein ACIBXB_013131 [Morphnus guianensis]
MDLTELIVTKKQRKKLQSAAQQTSFLWARDPIRHLIRAHHHGFPRELGALSCCQLPLWEVCRASPGVGVAVGDVGYKRSLGSSCSLCWTLAGRMRPRSSLGFALFCWVLGEVVASNPWSFIRGEAELWRYGGDLSLGQPHAFSQPSPWAWVDVSQLRAAAPLHPVAVQCQEAQMVVTVHRDLFGTGRLVRAADLTLGSDACLPAVWSAAETVVTFVAGLHECGSTLRVRLRGAGTLGWGSASWFAPHRFGVLRLAGGCGVAGLREMFQGGAQMTGCWEPLQQASSGCLPWEAAGSCLQLCECSMKLLHRKLKFEVASLSWERCGALRVTPDALVYSMSLNYKPTPAGNPVIIRTSPAVVPIECYYPRRDNVSSNGVKPTWMPFRSSLSSEEKLPFSLRLMNGRFWVRVSSGAGHSEVAALALHGNAGAGITLVLLEQLGFVTSLLPDDWSTERVSTIFQLGDILRFQAGVNMENHAPLRLFVDNCVATPTPDRSSSPQYAFIDFSG